ncbi:MAG: putative zinc-binding metallopeptidase [Prevotella sp.]|jgi:substrate import-associated zinc metallohydrolase lipoprotein|nr:putative zinc-binding metallopeptidase [Prevotella sp.]
MKKLFIYLPILFLVISLASCGEDLDTENSVFDDSLIKEKTDFDRWLDKYYVKPYNIQILYNYVDIETDFDYDLVPADLEKSKSLSILAKYLWIEPYEEYMGMAFFRTYAPRVLQYIGNPGWKSNNSIILGTAETGVKIALWNVNNLNMNDPSTYLRYIKTMHHEYAHIFQQQKITDPLFDQITPEVYVGDNWTGSTDLAAYRSGCVSTYAASSPIEDFVEIYSIFVTNTPEYWNNMLTAASTNADGSPCSGANYIRQKFDIVADYYKNSWGIDIYKMREIVNRRKTEILTLDLNSLYK